MCAPQYINSHMPSSIWYDHAIGQQALACAKATSQADGSSSWPHLGCAVGAPSRLRLSSVRPGSAPLVRRACLQGGRAKSPLGQPSMAPSCLERRGPSHEMLG